MNTEKKLGSISKLLKVMDILRKECPWDQKQTFESLRPLTLEETYELVDAIDNKNIHEIKHELGDLLLHVIFYSKIASESNYFDISDVADSITKKLIFRHPHVFDNRSSIDEKQVKNNWEKLKLKEGNKSILSGVPKSLPSILKAIRIQKKVSNVGFEWEEINDVKHKIYEEIEELNEEIKRGAREKIQDEFGDVLFSLINYARFLDIDPDYCLEKSNKKFIKRFKLLEKKMKQNHKSFENTSISELNEYWNSVK
ncbi:MAG: nucleoside triphosphate pyrophosphohydrolase [Flavobacteriales bacterium]|nr:nucleoside triphosphate pyrophosphohydrolase [Flavobacteriales bacterium]